MNQLITLAYSVFKKLELLEGSFPSFPPSLSLALPPPVVNENLTYTFTPCSSKAIWNDPDLSSTH